MASISANPVIQVTKLTAALIGNTQDKAIVKKIWRCLLQNELEATATLVANRFKKYQELLPQLDDMQTKVPYALLLAGTVNLMAGAFPAILDLMHGDGADDKELHFFLPSFVLEHTVHLLKKTKEGFLKEDIQVSGNTDICNCGCRQHLDDNVI